MTWTELIQPNIYDISLNLAKRAVERINSGIPVAPPPDKIFRALALTPPDSVKVCIIGQDPYHTPDAADGLAFSTGNKTTIQPSLSNIFDELCRDINCPRPSSGDLTPWALNGVLLLNTVLTVDIHKPAGHNNWGWQLFTSHIVDLCTKLPQPIVFITWGRYAQSLLPDTKLENTNKIAIRSSHPSPFSANKPCGMSPPFLNSKPFSTANNHLIANGIAPVNWELP